MSRVKAFPLSKYFVLSSFVAICIVALLTAFLSARIIRHNLLEEAKQHAARVTRHLQKDIFQHYLEPLVKRGESVDLEDAQQMAALDRVVQNVSRSFGIHSLYIIDRDRRIIYSTNQAHIGKLVPESNSLLQQAFQGGIQSVVLGRGNPLGPEVSRSTQSLLETYVPVYALGGLPAQRQAGLEVTNVIETYQDIQKVQAEVTEAQYDIMLYALGGGLFLFLALIGIVMRADRIIRAQTFDLLETNDQLAQLSHDLEEKVQARTEELIAQEKLASLGTMAAGLAHEVNNPLATVSSCAQGLQKRLRDYQNGGELEEADFVEYLDLIEAESFRVKSITQSLLDFSRQSEACEGQEVNVVELLRSTLLLFEVDHDADGIEFSIESDPESIQFYLQATEFRQLFYNVTKNAIDSILTRKKDEAGLQGMIQWRLKLGKDALELDCLDNGLGLESTNLSKSFQPFFTTKAPGKGTGLGLALCHSAVERHGGKVKLDNRLNSQGARLSVVIPIGSGKQNEG